MLRPLLGRYKTPQQGLTNTATIALPRQRFRNVVRQLRRRSPSLVIDESGTSLARGSVGNRGVQRPSVDHHAMPLQQSDLLRLDGGGAL